MSRNKALFFVSPFFGGASRMTITISQLLPKDKFDVKYIVFGKEIKEIRNFIPESCEVELLKIRSIWDFTILKMIRLFKCENPTVVFSSFSFLNLRVILAAKIVGGIRTVIRSDNMWEYFRGDIKFLMKRIYPFADVIIAQQDEMRAAFVANIPSLDGKIFALQNYLNTDIVDANLKATNPYSDNANVRFLWSGRVQRTKGHDALLKAFKLVHVKMPNSKLYILGKYDENSPYYTELRDYIRDNGLEESVTIVGFVNNPHVWIKYADCFVLPSRMEGLPNALLEAMYIGKPVVATTCIPIIERIVTDGYNGYAVEVDNTEMMADRMVKALELKDFHTTYKSATAEDYIKLFEG